eukprot:1192156-Prorocentrum_minimum.AAC.8
MGKGWQLPKGACPHPSQIVRMATIVLPYIGLTWAYTILPTQQNNITSSYGSSCAKNGKGALLHSTPQCTQHPTQQ